jgi:hypothetical protein
LSNKKGLYSSTGYCKGFRGVARGFTLSILSTNIDGSYYDPKSIDIEAETLISVDPGIVGRIKERYSRSKMRTRAYLKHF